MQLHIPTSAFSSSSRSASVEMRLVKPINGINAEGEPSRVEQSQEGVANDLTTGIARSRFNQAPYRATYENEKVDNIWIAI